MEGKNWYNDVFLQVTLRSFLTYETNRYRYTFSFANSYNLDVEKQLDQVPLQVLYLFTRRRWFCKVILFTNMHL